MLNEIETQLTSNIIPFWEGLRDDQFGGTYGWMDYDLKVDPKAVKGCILNSRITWFFAQGYLSLHDPALLEQAKHNYEFMKQHCFDSTYGGVYWSVTYDGRPEDTTKHTYNQAFAIYALSTYYDASKDPEALKLADSLFELIETKMRDEGGYLEAFRRDFTPESNEKLSENGVMAARTMNTILHVFEAYTEFYRVSGRADVKEKLEWILDVFAAKIYNPAKHRQEVFFDHEYHSLIDLHSYGHDIETAWLIDRATKILNEPKYFELMDPITADLVQNVYETGFDGHSLAEECERGRVNETRVWWVQAEAINGFLNAYEKNPAKKEYLEAAKSIWAFINAHVIDHRPNSEWYWEVNQDGSPIAGKPIVEPWKCPYHNGRMCYEALRRKIDA